MQAEELREKVAQLALSAAIPFASELSRHPKSFQDQWYRVADAIIPLVLEEAQVFLSEEYATGQPFSSMAERFACAQIAASQTEGEPR